jgi:hypothetical protein
VVLAGCSGEEQALPQGSEPVDLDPADFTLEIDNRSWPMTPGNAPGTGLAWPTKIK